MYIIVTNDESLANELKKKGANVFYYEHDEGNLTKLTNRDKSAQKITKLMTLFAIKPHLKGYDYIRFILEKCMQDENYHRNSLTNVIFQECASEFNTTSARVAKAVRHAISCGYYDATERYMQIFKKKVYKSPTNIEFICLMSKLLHNTETFN